VKCKECGQPTREFLVTYGGEKRFLFWKYPDAREIALCREHLIERFKMVFLSAPQRMVVLYPNLEEKNRNYQYAFIALSTVEQKMTTDKALNTTITQKARGWLDLIRGTCAECDQRQAEIAFFPREAIPWQRVPGYLGAPFDYPMLHQIDADPRILCRGCAFGHIERSLRMPVRGFEDGIFAPSDDSEGIYLTVEV
jgi:hypothetical protein